MGQIPKHLCNTHHMYVQHACTNALDDPTRPCGAPGHGIQPVLTLMWYNHIVKNVFLLSFYLIILGQLDNTSQRKLAHIQMLILLNYCFNSLTDITVSTFSCNMQLVSTTGPKLILFYFYIFPDTVISI